MKARVIAVLLMACGIAAGEEHRWIALVDVSGSSDAVDRERRLRRELLQLSQIFLAAGGEVDGRRSSALSVYFVGNEVRPAVPNNGALRWDNVPVEIIAPEPPDPGTRSRLDLGLERAASEFRQVSSFTRKHLLIISDGELDVDPNNRPTGAPFQEEERLAYRRIFSDTIPALRAAGVTVDAVALETGNLTEEHIRAQLLRTRGDTAAAQFLRFLDGQRGVALPIREGPYFLYALATSLSGQFHLAAEESDLANVVWQTMFPDSVRQRAVAPGSRALVVFAAAGDPVRLCVGGRGDLPDILIRDDRQTGAVSVQPPSQDINARYHATQNYTVWLIRAPNATCVEPGTAYHGSNVELRWVPGSSSWYRLDIHADMMRSAEGPPSLDWWRNHLAERIRQKQVVAVAKIWPPNSSQPIDVSLEPEPVSEGDAVLRFAARRWRPATGTYRCEVKVVVGKGDLAWEERLPAQDLVVPAWPWWVYTVFVAFVLTLTLIIWWFVGARVRAFVDDTVFWWRTRRASFAFVIHTADGPVVTEARHPKAVRITATPAGLDVDCGIRTNGHHPAAFFEASDRGNYRLYVGSGKDWQYRRLTETDTTPAFVTLRQNGVTISLLDFVQKHAAFDVRHSDATVQIRHIVRSAPITEKRSHANGQS